MIKLRRMGWAGYAAQVREMRNAYSILVGKPVGKIPLGGPRRRWVDNIRMDLRKMGRQNVDWCIWLRVGPSVRSL
jgi:hypothetical protein